MAGSVKAPAKEVGMKSFPDLDVFVSWPFLFVETGNCKDNNLEFTMYMSRSLLR